MEVGSTWDTLGWFVRSEETNSTEAPAGAVANSDQRIRVELIGAIKSNNLIQQETVFHAPAGKPSSTQSPATDSGSNQIQEMGFIYILRNLIKYKKPNLPSLRWK